MDTVKPKILYEDNHILVAIKPPNLPSQADESGDMDMLSLCREHLRTSRGKPGQAYIGLVHRLDRPAGGLMAFACTSKAATRLSAQFAEKSAGREYLAVVRGKIPEGTHVHWLADRNGMVRAVPEGTKGAKRAELAIEILQEKDDLTLVRVTLKTGRKHQIRAQCAALGHPLWGDQRYAFGLSKPGEQLALWGYRLQLVHPTMGEAMEWEQNPEGGVWGKFEIC